MVLYQESMDDCWMVGYEWDDSGVLYIWVIFRIRHYGKFTFAREMRGDRVFPVGTQGIWNEIVGQWGRVAAQLDQELVPFHTENP